jgi:hypothetical protein
VTVTAGKYASSLLPIDGKCCGYCLILRQSFHPSSAGSGRGSLPQHPVIVAVAGHSYVGIAWHGMCIKGRGMDTQPEGMMSVREDGHASGQADEWSLSSHSPGQEPWIVGLEKLVLLQRADGNDDGLAGELALIEN